MKLGYSAIFWQEPDLERCLAALAEAGWEGWECRLPLDWLGTPARVRRVCADAGMSLAVFTASGTPEDRSFGNRELNRRRIEFAAEVEADCFMFMTGPKPSGRAVTDADLQAAAEAADEWAQDALIPPEVWDNGGIVADSGPIAVMQMAAQAGVHPAIVAGRIRYESGNYRLLSQFVGTGEVRRQFAARSS